MENMDKTCPDLIQVLGSITPISADFQQRINDQLLHESFPANKLLLRPGETARRIYFIKKGMVRAYSIDQNGREITSWLMGPGELIISVHSFFSQRPGQEYIHVLQPAELQSLTWNQLNAYYADYPEGNLIGRLLTQRYYILSEERSILFRTTSPLERYHILLDQHPKIEQQTTQSNIASYLGITRETLSRLKSSLVRKPLTSNH